MRAVLVSQPAVRGAALHVELGTYCSAFAPKQSDTAEDSCVGNVIRDDGVTVSLSPVACQRPSTRLARLRMGVRCPPSAFATSSNGIKRPRRRRCRPIGLEVSSDRLLADEAVDG